MPEEVRVKLALGTHDTHETHTHDTQTHTLSRVFVRRPFIVAWLCSLCLFGCRFGSLEAFVFRSLCTVLSTVIFKSVPEGLQGVFGKLVEDIMPQSQLAGLELIKAFVEGVCGCVWVCVGVLRVYKQCEKSKGALLFVLGSSCRDAAAIVTTRRSAASMRR